MLKDCVYHVIELQAGVSLWSDLYAGYVSSFEYGELAQLVLTS